MCKYIDRAWRVAATGFSFAIFGLGGCLLGILILVTLYPSPFDLSRKQRWTRQSISVACWIYVRIMRGLGLLSFSFANPEQLKQPGQLVIANHPTLLDVVFLLSQMPAANCIVKAELWRNPFTAGPVRLAGYLRNDAVLIEQAAAKINGGQTLIIFPEGTRTRPGQAMKFKRGFANIAQLAKCKVTPVIIDCSPPTLQKYQKWYQIPERPPKFTFTVLAPINVGERSDFNRPKTIQVRHLTRLFQTVLQGRPVPKH